MKDWLGYKDKVCVVTGASSGMGRAVVENLVGEGAVVYGMDRNPCDVEGVTFIQTDLSDKASIDAAKTLGFAKNQLDVPAALPLYNTKFMQNIFKKQI